MNTETKKTRVMIALGGNAILKHTEEGTAEEQMHNVRATSKLLVELVQDGYQLAITHGNGPQVGDILLKNDMAKSSLPPMPLDICSSESQGMIGYMLQQSMYSELCLAGVETPIATIVTQTKVNSDDPAFTHPTKPVGPFYTAMEASKLREEKGWTIINDSGRGYRRVVPSPQPVSILEKTVIRTLFDDGTMVIASGGGGVPGIKKALFQKKGQSAFYMLSTLFTLQGQINREYKGYQSWRCGAGGVANEHSCISLQGGRRIDSENHAPEQ